MSSFNENKTSEKEANKVDSNDHCHFTDDQSTRKKNRVALYKLLAALTMCVVFMIAEIIGGLLANSISIQTDAAHMAADIAGYFISVFAILVSNKKPTRRLTFGYGRSEIIGALVSVSIIWLLTGVLVYLAAMRVINRSFEIDPLPMVITASCGVVFNISMFLVLETNCISAVRRPQPQAIVENDTVDTVEAASNKNSDAKSKNKQEKAKTNSEESNVNVRAAVIHVIGDLIQSVGVLVAAVLIFINPKNKLADPICTFIFSALVMTTTAIIIKDIFFVLMEAVPSHLKYDDILNDLKRIENVKDIHELNIWGLTMEKCVLTVHLVIEKGVDEQQVLKDANNMLKTKHKLDKTNIQVEFYAEGMKTCSQCKLP